MGYMALDEVEDAAARNVIEGLMLIAIVGGIVGGAAYAWVQLRKTGSALSSLDLSEALLAAERKIDAPLREALARGDIRLVRCSWLLSAEADACLRSSGRIIAKRMQELPPEALFSPEEAAALLDGGDRSILALSYRWLTGLHPEPHGTTLAAVRRHLRREGEGEGVTALRCGLFWDFLSLPQKDGDGKRTEEETQVFARALKVMARVYASVTGTTVLALKDIPPRPAEYDGRITLFGRDGVDAELRAQLVAFGEVLELSVSGAQVNVRFATHEQAEAAVAALPAAATVYNSTRYDRDGGGGPYSGWCTFEQGTGKMVVAHLTAVVRRAAERQRPLPARLACAEASRAKVIDISGGASSPLTTMEQSPEELLEDTMEAIEHATFVGKGDRPMVQQLLGELEWDMKAAAAEATAQHAESGLTVDPKVMRVVRYNARIVRPSVCETELQAAPSRRLLADAVSSKV
jgi:hypothetical protein